MKLRYDKQVDAAYFQVRDTAVAQTIEIDLDLYVDLDKENRVVGVEILNAREYLATNSINLEIPDQVDPSKLTRELVLG